MIKKIWRYQASVLVRLINEALKVDSVSCDAGNDGVNILDLFLGLLCVVQDYKTGVQVDWTLPISATKQQSTRAILLTGGSAECGCHDFSFKSLTPSATLQMNLTDTPGESLFSGSEDGNGRIYVSVHDSTMDYSTGLKHVPNIYIIMRYKSEMSTLGLIIGRGQPTPYFFLVGCDGGPDHNLGHLANYISLFALFLVGNMYKLVATHSFPVLSYMSTSKRAMDILNIELSGLAL